MMFTYLNRLTSIQKVIIMGENILLKRIIKLQGLPFLRGENELKERVDYQRWEMDK